MKKIFIVLMLLIVTLSWGQEVNIIKDDFSEHIELHIMYFNEYATDAYLLYFGLLDEPMEMGAFAVSEEYTYYNDDGVDAVFKFDNKIAHDVKLLTSTDGRFVFIDFVQLGEELFSSDILYLRIYDFQNNPHTYKFKISGFRKTWEDSVKKYK